MKIADALDLACRSARNVKDEHVRRVKGKAGRTDIQTVVACWRGDRQVALVFTHPDRDRMLDIAHMAAVGFSADVLAVTMETFSARILENPVTGEPWGHGEMAQVVEQHDGLAKGWVHEALMTQVLNRAGDVAGRIQPYVLDGGRTVEWVDTPPDAEGAELRGLVPDALAAAMAEPTMLQHAGRDMMARHLLAELGAERAAAHADVGVVRVLEERYGGEVMVLLAAEPGSVREQVIRERFPRSQVIRPEG